MTKEQFMMELEQSLQGEVSAYELSDSLTYYRQYFEDEIRNGKSEEDVIQELGSPRLIARSIIDAHGMREPLLVIQVMKTAITGKARIVIMEVRMILKEAILKAADSGEAERCRMLEE